MGTLRRALGGDPSLEPQAPVRVDPRLCTTEEDARSVLRSSRIHGALLLIHYALVVFASVPPWTMAVVLPLVMGRYMVVLHELIHVRSERQVDALTRLWLVQAVVGPVTVGYREFRVFHLRHHAYLLTERDPDRYQITCGNAVGLFHTLTSPEQNVVRWIAENGLDRSLAGHMIARLAIFAALARIGGPSCLWFFVPLRIAFGVALFLFSHVLHRRGPEVGVFPIAHSRWSRGAMRFLFGEIGLQAISNHDVHHAAAAVSPFRLEAARSVVDEADRSDVRRRSAGAGS